MTQFLQIIAIIPLFFNWLETLSTDSNEFKCKAPFISYLVQSAPAFAH